LNYQSFSEHYTACFVIYTRLYITNTIV